MDEHKEYTYGEINQHFDINKMFGLMEFTDKSRYYYNSLRGAYDFIKTLENSTFSDIGASVGGVMEVISDYDDLVNEYGELYIAFNEVLGILEHLVSDSNKEYDHQIQITRKTIEDVILKSKLKDFLK